MLNNPQIKTLKLLAALSDRTVEYANCTTARHFLPMSVLDMTLNHLMVRLQSWSFGEYRVPFRNPTDFNTKKNVNFWCKKISLRNNNFCIWIFAFINQLAHVLVLKFQDTLQTTVFDLLQIIWRIKTQNNFRNLFPSKLLKIRFLSQLDS